MSHLNNHICPLSYVENHWYPLKCSMFEFKCLESVSFYALVRPDPSISSNILDTYNKMGLNSHLAKYFPYKASHLLANLHTFLLKKLLLLLLLFI
jgi:hypothetical protein